ncbi:Ctr copper transporter family-domain-containing protein [Ilyonectria robusta]|uniref:Ctr copper transporter family-domain-containing protein n=1 Tax=Ilyonectria robusta TaxID=1079257 RepID=UPI001E8D81A7|nr:Ctr copper transporter family-domain-containing protein [Ilyonectria robusta]KAH8677047.1 Ctr copper transporter family-domain-containing protein [Ilyonectria robusta]
MTFFPRHDMTDMDSDSSSSNSSSDSHSTASMMTMIFQTQRETPLYASSWTPSSAGAYAGTCIFLVVLTIIGRLVLAFKAVQEARWLDREAARRYVTVNGKIPLAEQISVNPDARQMTLSANGAEETVMVVERKRGVSRPWRFSVDPIRALLDTILAGIGYLLMLAVMTMNVGYFMSVLAGVFIGSLAVGRYTQVTEH